MSQKTQINGWLNLHKPLGVTSAKAVAIVKRNLSPTKIGHAGTLDPLASGVLPLALGEATKTMQFCMDTTKEYEFTVKWGKATTTGDIEGDVTNTSDIRPSEEEILAILPKFIGKISQIPPTYSAIKINGKRAYDLARQGEIVEMKARNVMIYNLQVLGTRSQALGKNNSEATDFALENDFSTHNHDSLPKLPETCHLPPTTCTTFLVSCGKGTYIRSLAQDIAHALGTCGHVTRLVRTKVGEFSINNAILLEDIGKTVYKDDLSGVLLPVDTVLDDIQVLEFTPEEATRMKHGQKLGLQNLELGTADLPLSFSGYFIAKSDGNLVAICECEGGVIKPSRVFNL